MSTILEYQKQFARVLRIDAAAFADFDTRLTAASGKPGIIKALWDENGQRIASSLDALCVGRTAPAEEIFDALTSKIEADDVTLYEGIGLRGATGKDAAAKVCDFVSRVTPPEEGFFLKEDVARELLRANPPAHILAALGYRTVDEMLKKEDLFEVFSALRFLEDTAWLNAVFFKQYEELMPDSFERRTIQIRALDAKWADAAEKFVAKKYHNVSHLKELGVIFVIPIFLGISGETLRLISLLMHYRNEVKYYSDLFEQFAREDGFAQNVISLLRGDVLERREQIAESGDLRFMVVQRYLAKDDENDWRLFVPHVNPEAVHWRRAEKGIVQIPSVFPHIHNGLHFWDGLGWVGGHFPSAAGEVLVSFNIVDTVMSLVKRADLIKYLYHHQEALWNEMFIRAFGEEEMLRLTRENIVKGWFEV